MATFCQNSKITRVSAAVAAGTGDTVTSDIVDMAGYSSVTFIVGFGAIVSTAETEVTVEQDSAANMAAAAALSGSDVTVADDDDDQIVVVEVKNPAERYVRASITRATANATIDFILAVQSDPVKAPVTQPATVVDAVALNAPAEA